MKSVTLVMSQPHNLKNHTPAEDIGYLPNCAGRQLNNTVDRGLAQFEMMHAQFCIFINFLHGRANTAADLA